MITNPFGAVFFVPSALCLFMSIRFWIITKDKAFVSRGDVAQIIVALAMAIGFGWVAWDIMTEITTR